LTVGNLKTTDVLRRRFLNDAPQAAPLPRLLRGGILRACVQHAHSSLDRRPDVA
jgi:hypothetical protein